MTSSLKYRDTKSKYNHLFGTYKTQTNFKLNENNSKYYHPMKSEWMTQKNDTISTVNTSIHCVPKSFSHWKIQLALTLGQSCSHFYLFNTFHWFSCSCDCFRCAEMITRMFWNQVTATTWQWILVSRFFVIRKYSFFYHADVWTIQASVDRRALTKSLTRKSIPVSSNLSKW